MLGGEHVLGVVALDEEVLEVREIDNPDYQELRDEVADLTDEVAAANRKVEDAEARFVVLERASLERPVIYRDYFELIDRRDAIQKRQEELQSELRQMEQRIVIPVRFAHITAGAAGQITEQQRVDKVVLATLLVLAGLAFAAPEQALSEIPFLGIGCLVPGQVKNADIHRRT